MRPGSPIGPLLTLIVAGLVAGACSPANNSTAPSSSKTAGAPTNGAVAFDAARKVVVLVTPGPSPTAETLQTWTWDGRSWLQLRPATSPPMRSDPVLVYDEARQVTILYGGLGRSAESLNDTWEWDGSTWSLQLPAHSPAGAFPGQAPGSMAYDPTSQRVLLYQMAQRLWSWDGNDWRQLRPTHIPAALDGSLTFDGKRVILLGTQIWGWTGSDWRNLSSHVPELAPLEPAVLDRGTGKVLLYGGGPGDDTWTWNGSGWNREHPKHSPVSAWPPRLIDDGALHAVIAFAADDYRGPITGTYAWNGTDWSAVDSTTPPAAVAGKRLMSPAAAAAKVRHTVTSTAPVLLPSLPAGVDQVMVTADAGNFSMTAWNDDRSIKIILATGVLGNSNLGAATATILFRNASAYYQYIATDPNGWRSISWTEPAGHWAGDSATPPSNGVPYILSTTGLSESEFFALGNSLR